jgi:hypothetical protein
VNQTRKKTKHWQDRTSNASRTRKSKPYNGPRNVRQTVNIGEGRPPMHEGRMLSHAQYWELVTRGLAGSVRPSFTRASDGQPLGVTLHERAEMNRRQFRKIAMPWRRDGVN